MTGDRTVRIAGLGLFCKSERRWVLAGSGQSRFQYRPLAKIHMKTLYTQVAAPPQES
jgi:hypothetical protein